MKVASRRSSSAAPPTPSRAAAAAEALLADPVALADRVHAAVAGRPSLVVVGRGTARAAAEMGGLVLKEAAQVQAESLDTGEFRHGPLELAGPELGLVVVATEPATRTIDLGLFAEVAAIGAAALVIAGPRGRGPAAGRDRGRRAALDPGAGGGGVPLQLLAWRIAREKGRDPGRFTLATKVTTRE